MSGPSILIARGYGVVGSRIAVDLAPDYPGRVVVAGSHAERAHATAASIGHGVRGRALDVYALLSIAPGFGRCCGRRDLFRSASAIERGARNTDITPHLTELGRHSDYETINAAARLLSAHDVDEALR